MSEPSICIFGAVGHNIGDEAVAVAGIEELSRRLPAARFLLASLRADEAQSETQAFQTFLRRRGDLIGTWRQLKRASHFLLGGGTLIQDALNTGKPWRGPLPSGLIATEMARRMGIPAASMSIGVDRLQLGVSRLMARRLASRLDPLIVRDRASAQELEGIGVSPDRIHIAADPAFLLAEEEPDDGVRKSLRTPYMTVSVLRENLNPLNYRDAVVAACRAAADAGRQVVFVPMDDRPGEDVDEVRAIVRELDGAADHLVMSARIPATQLAWVLRRAEVSVAMRLHAMILSLGDGTQVIGITRGLKTSTFLSRHSDARVFSADARVEPGSLRDELNRALAESPRRRAERARAQTERVEQDRAAARSAFDLLERWIRQTSSAR